MKYHDFILNLNTFLHHRFPLKETKLKINIGAITTAGNLLCVVRRGKKIELQLTLNWYK